MYIQRNNPNLRSNLSRDEMATPMEKPASIVKPARLGNRGWFLTLILVIILAAALFTAFYFYRQVKQLKNSTADESQSIVDLVAEVSQLIVLPTGEEPTAATVTDLSKLKGQPFFTNAKIGDKLLIYTQAKKAILYDPQAKKIVEVAPLNIDSQEQTSPFNVNAGTEQPAEQPVEQPTDSGQPATSVETPAVE